MRNTMKTDLFTGTTLGAFKPIREEILEAMSTTYENREDIEKPTVNDEKLCEVIDRPPRR